MFVTAYGYPHPAQPGFRLQEVPASFPSPFAHPYAGAEHGYMNTHPPFQFEEPSVAPKERDFFYHTKFDSFEDMWKENRPTLQSQNLDSSIVSVEGDDRCGSVGKELAEQLLKSPEKCRSPGQSLLF